MASLQWLLTGKPENNKEKKMQFRCKIWNAQDKMRVDTLEAPNPEALLQIYGMLGQKIEIIEGAGVPQNVPQFENGNASANAIFNAQGPAEIPLAEQQIPDNGIDPQKIVPYRAPPRPETLIPVPVIPPPKPIMFEDGGIKFKIENGVVWKKVWRDLTDVEQSEYRVVPKPGDNDCKGMVQKLDWIKIEGGSK